MEAGFINLLISWGPTAVSSVLVFVVSFLIKYLIGNTKKEEERTDNLRKEFKKIHDDINNTINNFGDRLSIVEKDSVKSDLFYREMSGWRSEINRISDLIITQFMSFSQNIIQLLSQGKK